MVQCELSSAKGNWNELIEYQINTYLFFDRRGIIYKEIVTLEQNVTQRFYKYVVERLKRRAIRVRPKFANIWMLHHDNTPCHTALSLTQFLTSKYIPVVSPLDLGLYNFFLN